MPSGWGHRPPRAAQEPVPAFEGLSPDAAMSVTARMRNEGPLGVAAPGGFALLRAEAHQGLRMQPKKCALHNY